MASTGQKAPSKSYARVASKKTEKKTSIFAETVCKLSIPEGYPTRGVPSTEEKCVLFVDLNGHNEEEVAEVIKDLNVTGTVYRSDLNTLELVFSAEEERSKTLAIKFTTKSGKNITLMRPRHECPKLVYVRVANMPFGDEKTLKEALNTHWQQYGIVVDIGVHKQKATGWRTRRWDLLVGLKEDETSLKAPVAYEINGRKVVAAWPGSPPSCLACHSAGHQAKKCLQKNPKVGGRPDPEKKDRQEKSKKGKDTETVLEALPKPKQAKIGEETVSATVSESASTSISKSVTKSADSGVKEPEMIVEDTAEQMEVEGMVLKPLEAKKTPRSESGKRRSKAMGVPRNYVNPTFDADIKVVVSRDRRFCGNCGMLHETESCEEEYPYDANVAQQIIRQILSQDEEEKKKAKEARQHAMELRKRDVVTKAMASGSGEVADWCIKCRKKGHLQRECKHPDCTRCESKDHIVKFCPVGGVYATERKK
jgi:hypothetical protein